MQINGHSDQCLYICRLNTAHELKNQKNNKTKQKNETDKSMIEKKVTHLPNCFATPLPAFTPFTQTHSLHPFHFTISTPFRVLYLIFCHLCAASFASDSHNDKNSDASIVFTFMPSTCKQLNRMFGGGLWLRHKTAASHV